MLWFSTGRGQGDWMSWSNWDVLVVAKFGEPFLKKLRALLELACPAVEPIGYTPEEFERGLRALNPTVISALVEGRALYGGDYLDAVRRRIKWARKGECVWEVELAD